MTAPGAGEAPSNALHGLLRRVVDVRAGEVRAMLTSFAFFFFLLSSYFVLRPIRDAVAAASGVTKLPWLFSGTLAVTLICNPLFSGLVARIPVRRVIPVSYHFFVASFLIFYVALRYLAAGEGSRVDVLMSRAFFIWTTVFALFNTSIFWSLMADVFRSEQAKRMFGFIGVGGTLGSIIGSAATAALAPRLGAVNLLLVSAALVELAIITIVAFPLSSHGTSDVGARRPDREVIGGSIWAGFTNVVKSPYLLAICAFMILYTLGSTVLYFAQSDIVGRFYADRTARTAMLAQLEMATQVLTVLTQIFFTGRIIRWLGLAASLAVLPVLSIVGLRRAWRNAGVHDPGGIHRPAARQQLRAHQSGDGGALHGRAARGQVQGEEHHRDVRLSRRRSGGGLGLCRSGRARVGPVGYLLCRHPLRRCLVRDRHVARTKAGGTRRRERGNGDPAVNGSRHDLTAATASFVHDLFGPLTSARHAGLSQVEAGAGRGVRTTRDFKA